MYELLLLLLPVAAASGWFAARRSMEKGDDDSRNSALNTRYFKGLNYLLNEQPDKAIDVFVEMLEVDSETVETHIALGSLFRRRGETERAIRIHQNLIARPTLDREQRAQALLELGQDYMKAGLFDRAESLFNELVELHMYQFSALSNLLLIYQQEKDWNTALKTAEKYEARTGKSLRLEQAHFYCELTEEALKQHRHSEAANLLKKAQNTDRSLVRPVLLQAGLEKDKGNFKSAIRLYERAFELDDIAVDEIILPLKDCFIRLGSAQGVRPIINKMYVASGNVSLAITLSDLIEQSEGTEKAIEFMKDFLEQTPDLRVLRQLMNLYLRSGRSETDTDVFSLVRSLLEITLKRTPVYKCGKCGYAANKLLWHCPGCNSWSTMVHVETLQNYNRTKPIEF